MIAAFGFGGIPNYMGEPEVSHCFNLNGDEKDPTIIGLDKLETEYKKAVLGTTMWGPTLFAPLHKIILNYMDHTKELPMYHILLLLTDGQMHDIRETIDLIVKCSNYPLSIIIVGVGDSDFKSMKFLDSDDINLVDGEGTECKRDIVQFVQLSRFIEDGVI